MLPFIAATAIAASPSVSAQAAPSKVLIVMEENHSRTQALAGMPYLASLAATYGQETEYYSVASVSLPNYLAIAAGSTFGGSTALETGPTVFDQAIAAGDTGKTYAESMPTNCDRTSVGDYKRGHNPWTYFTGTSYTNCLADDVPYSLFPADVAAGALPTIGMVVPNVKDDAHTGSLGKADAWLKKMMTTVKAGPDWQSGRLAVIVTFDEGGNVAFVVAYPGLAGRTVTTYFGQGHYSLSRDLSEFVGAAPLHNAATAEEGLFAAFGL
jgi:hypothetical protein